jgi:hypothetical protein
MACDVILYAVSHTRFLGVEEVEFCCFDVVLGRWRHFTPFNLLGHLNKAVIKMNQTKPESKCINKNMIQNFGKICQGFGAVICGRTWQHCEVVSDCFETHLNLTYHYVSYILLQKSKQLNKETEQHYIISYQKHRTGYAAVIYLTCTRNMGNLDFNQETTSPDWQFSCFCPVLRENRNSPFYSWMSFDSTYVNLFIWYRTVK